MIGMFKLAGMGKQGQVEIVQKGLNQVVLLQLPVQKIVVETHEFPKTPNFAPLNSWEFNLVERPT